MINDLVPLLDPTARLSVIVATVVISIRVLNATYKNSQQTWQQTAVALTDSADYAKAETNRLRDRVEGLEVEARQFAVDRATWLTERAQLMSRITHLEDEVHRLTEELDIFKTQEM